MTKTLLKFVMMFFILIVAQAVVFNHICLFGCAVPLVFIYLIIKLPTNLSVNWAMTIGFLLGLMVDIFSDTQGMNALCCTLLSTFRRPVLHLYVPRDDDMTDHEPSSRSMGRTAFLKYEFSMSLIYCMMFFMVGSMTFFGFGRTLLKIVGSSLLTFIFIMIIDSLTNRRREKRL